MTDAVLKDKLMEAIQNQNRIVFDYQTPKDLESTHRIGDPYALFYLKDNGKATMDEEFLAIHMYQNGGEANTRLDLPKWMTFKLIHMKNLMILTSEHFEARPNEELSKMQGQYIIRL